jgi:hypothetical protein
MYRRFNIGMIRRLLWGVNVPAGATPVSRAAVIETRPPAT